MATRARDVYRSDRLMRYAGEGMGRAAPGKLRILARALDVSEMQASREKKGHRYAQSTRFIESIAQHTQTDAFAMLAEGYAVTMQAQVEDRPTAELVAELWRLDDAEHSLEAAENGTGHRLARPCEDPAEALRRSAKADIDEAAAQLYRAAIKRELAERGVDPYAEGRPS